MATTSRRMRKLATGIIDQMRTTLASQTDDELTDNMWLGGPSRAVSKIGDEPVYGFSVIALTTSREKIRTLSEIMGTIEKEW